MSKEIFDFIKRYESFKESPQYHFYSFIKENRLYMSILRENYRDLQKIIKFHNSPVHDNILWMTLDSKIRRKTQIKVTKSLLNHLSSIFSVVDYSRRKLKPYLQKKTSIFEAYEQKVNLNFKLNPHHCFVQGLRNFAIHYSYLKIVSSIKFNKEINNSTRSIYISKSVLLKYTNWDNLSKSLLNSLDDKIHIIDLITEHYRLFIQFQDWAFLNLFLVDNDLSKGVYEEMLSLLNEATTLGLNHNLPFDNVSYGCK